MIEHDDNGPFLAVGFDRADRVRDSLTAAGVPFREEDPSGCSGPIYALFRFEPEVPLEEVEQLLSRTLG